MSSTRFITEDMLELQKDKYSKRTINATAYAERLLKQFTSTTKTYPQSQID
jgi:hypothetical protein